MTRCLHKLKLNKTYAQKSTHNSAHFVITAALVTFAFVITTVREFVHLAARSPFEGSAKKVEGVLIKLIGIQPKYASDQIVLLLISLLRRACNATPGVELRYDNIYACS